jgi:tetratricopeptide (TPR) repeat protein
MDVTLAKSDTRRGVRRSTALARVITFSQKFGEIYLDLACHAAFPLVLTPDLLYRIWSIFVPQAPWTSVSDILLSGLCREVGHELYEMDLTVRELLLEELKQNDRFGLERLNGLADFLIEYVAHQLKSRDQEEAHLAEAQRWTALAYTRPSAAAREIAMALSKLRPEDEEELFRLSSLVETFATSLGEFGLLLSYTRSMTRLVYGDIKGAAEQIDKLPRHKNHVLVAGVSLSIPEQIVSQMDDAVDTQAALNPASTAGELQDIAEQPSVQPSGLTDAGAEVSVQASEARTIASERQAKASRKSLWPSVHMPNVLDRLFGKDQKPDVAQTLGCEFTVADVIEQRYEIEQVHHDSNVVSYTAYDRYNREQVTLITYQNRLIWNDGIIARFRSEIVGWAQLSRHANIAHVQRIRTVAGKLYAFVEHGSEITLRSCIADLSYRDVVQYAIQICWAMIHANKQGLTVHGDVRPENITVTPERQIKVGNFGVSRSLIVQPWLVQISASHDDGGFLPNVEMLGSLLPYMAPESLKGVSYKDNRMDIYSFGITLYELFTGKLPYDSITGESIEKLRLTESFADPRMFKPDMHSDAINVILRCLAVKPSERYQSFEAVEADLQSLHINMFGVKYSNNPAPDSVADAALLLERGLIYIDLGRYKEALHHFHRSVGIDQKYVEGWINLARAHIRLYQYNEAVRVVEDGLRYAKTRSDYAQLYQASGEALTALALLDKAVEAFDQALSYLPNAPALLREKGRVLQRIGQSREAQQCFEQAIRYDKFDAYSWLLLGEILLDKRNFKQAYHAYGQSLKIDPQSAIVWSRYGACQMGLSRPHEAVRSYEMALKLDPDLEEAREGLRRARMNS